ncbi:phosphotransferase family protein [Nocardia asteroides]|uniref:phosphotransferase family protein n=1 Tax=Nocardia asteroides TaxID=1824 RepID=UPI001E583FA4|nr:phosphotransferase family protein [Nocardia asteroides]UGT63617.1 phosphotransferase family protein [Nocardia asteroides]
MGDEADPTQRHRLTVSAGDLDDFGARLTAWLDERVSADHPPAVTVTGRPESGGMSSTTILFDAHWTVDGRAEGGSFVARMAPEAAAFPVFPQYDLAAQFRVISEVGAASPVPVPPLVWLEESDAPLGTPFFVMRRVDGVVPADNPPYVFVGWLFDATPEQRAEVGMATVDVIADVHAIPHAEARFGLPSGPGQPLRRHVRAQRAWYDWALADDGYRIPIIERAFDWLDANWPADPGPAVLCWGDARPGNIIWEEWRPLAVLDWEMAAIVPREVDLGWIIFIHRFFQDIAERFEQPGLPDFLRRADVVARYESRTGHTVRDLDFYLVYAALRHAIVMARIKRRMIHFGEDTDTADRDDYVMHRASLEALLDGAYRWE